MPHTHRRHPHSTTGADGIPIVERVDPTAREREAVAAFVHLDVSFVPHRFAVSGRGRLVRLANPLPSAPRTPTARTNKDE